MQISFYVLADHYANHPSNSHEALLNFVCKLTQTVLKKSELGLVIVDDNIERLKHLDEQLWSFDPVSFIPHSLLSVSINDRTSPINPSTLITESNANLRLTDASLTIGALTTSNPNDAELDLNDLAAPVILTTQMPVGFDGVVLNLAAAPLFSSSTSTLTSADSDHNSSVAAYDDERTELGEQDIEVSQSDSKISPSISPSTRPSNRGSVGAPIDSQILPQRILEIIAPDEISKQRGRDKYKFYQSQGWQLTYHPIN